MKKSLVLLPLACTLLLSVPGISQKKSKGDENAVEEGKILLEKTPLAALSFRSIGPAVTGGRIIDIDVNPQNPSEYYIASGHGSLWKTTNRGTTFSPAFEGQSAFAIGAVTLDPQSPNTVWVGTGENNSQGNVIYGDGVYKSTDGGKTWENKGLKESQHIGGIVVHPENSDKVLVAAYGPLRNSGGDRGVFMSLDGGETWENVLNISENTGCWQLHMDPSDPDIIYAVAHQRQRRLHTRIWGGPESGIYKTEDGGKNWKKLVGGLPTESVGRIGLAVSPADPNVVYAVVEAKEGDGFYRSRDKGNSWEKQGGFVSSYPFYMQKLAADPVDVDRVYGMDVFMQVSTDGGESFSRLSTSAKHVDEHALWIDPENPRHMLSGCDGGLYETFDRGVSWIFHNNIPIAEIYKVSLDNASPFYNVYIGTQDNNSLYGPSRTIRSSGITNADWTFTWGGDGFESQADWKDDNTVYSQSQFGGLARYNKTTGERLYIKPYETGDTAYRFDWDAGFLLSGHDNKRLYFGGNKLLRSDDQGATWREISGDLTRGVPLEFLLLMGRSWSKDELAGKGAMAQIATIAESPLDENILYTGSRDGLIHMTADGGKSWKKGKIEGLPDNAQVHHIVASHHNKDVAYAACNHFLTGDYQPYLYKTTDGGTSWQKISANLPERGSTYTIGEDHEDPDLLFVGTQFGLYFSNTPKHHWIKLSNGFPTTTVMDLDIHRGENDLVASTFGRGVFILDDYTPLRNLDKEDLEAEAIIFPVSEAKMFIEADPFAFPGVGFMGEHFYTADNPEIGAVITYYLKEKPKSLKEQRREEEKKLAEAGETIRFPSFQTQRDEAEEVDPFLLFTIADAEGNQVRTIKKGLAAGMHRLVWDFRYDNIEPVSLEGPDTSVPWNTPPQGFMAAPGEYTVTMQVYREGEFRQLAGPVSFTCSLLFGGNPSEAILKEIHTFNRDVAQLARAVAGTQAHLAFMRQRIPYLKKAALETQSADPALLQRVIETESSLTRAGRSLNGDNLRAQYEGASPTSVRDRVELITGALWSTTEAPTSTFKRAYTEASSQFAEVLEEVKSIDGEIKEIEAVLEKIGAPYTPGRVPAWKK